MPTEFKRIFFVQAKMFFMIPDYKGLTHIAAIHHVTP